MTAAATIDSAAVAARVANPSVLWVGTGAMFGRCREGLARAVSDFQAKLACVDVLDLDAVRCPPPDGAAFFNISRAHDLSRLRHYLAEEEISHIYVANLAHQHILTAFALAEPCSSARVVIAKPLDTNFSLIETLSTNCVWPTVTTRMFEHDHYRNKGAVVPMYKAFPELIRSYGRVTRFEFYLIEHNTVEDEDRLDALADGVIFDLSTHLFALVQLLFLDYPHPGLSEPGLEVSGATLRINKVARARYTRCQIENVEAETFAAIDVILTARYSGLRREIVREVPGFLAVGKGIRPASNVCASLKGLRFEQELQPRCVNLVRNEVNPPLADLNHVREDGFTRTITDALTKDKPHECACGEQIAQVVSFREAAARARLLETVARTSSTLQFYRAGDTLDSVMAQCVAGGALDPKWLSRGGYIEIGYA